MTDIVNRYSEYIEKLAKLRRDEMRAEVYRETAELIAKDAPLTAGDLILKAQKIEDDLEWQKKTTNS